MLFTIYSKCDTCRVEVAKSILRSTRVSTSVTKLNVVDSQTTIGVDNILGAIVRDLCTIERPRVRGDGWNIAHCRTVK